MTVIRHGYSTAPRRNGSTRAYRNNRAQVLAGATHCELCGQPFTDEDPAVTDHITPHAYGGTITVTNLRPAHASCNKRRGTG